MGDNHNIRFIATFRTIVRLSLLFSITVCIYSCSVTKSIPPNDALYTGSDVKLRSIKDSSKVKEKTLQGELESLVRPAPNKSFLGIPFKLMIFNMVDTPKANKGLKYWLKYKVGEPPVLASSVNLEKNRQIMENRLENNGYFHSEATVDSTVKNKKMHATYVALLTKQYKIKNTYFPTDSGFMYNIMRTTSRRTLLKPGRPYSLDLVKGERERIDKRLKEKGFFFFNATDIIVNVDSTIGDNMVNMYIKIKRSARIKSLFPYRINNVIVYADYSINRDSSVVLDSTKKFQGYYIIDPEKKFNPKIFPQTLIFKPGDLYSSRAHSMALNRLVSLGVYKFVKAQFVEDDTVHRPMLNAYYYLTPTAKKSIRLEASGLTKSNNSNGADFTLSWRHRNFLKGAELFTLSAYAGFERQYTGVQRVHNNRVGLTANLLIPRIIAPFRFRTNSDFVPQTSITAGYELYMRSAQYTLSSATGSFGYIWKENIKTEHNLKVLSVNFVRPTNITDSFRKEIDTNITLARAVERQFIIGPIYNYNFNTQLQPNRRQNNYYFNGNLDLSSNLLGLVTGASEKEGKQKEIFGTPFSQYVRAEVDFRHYLRISKDNMFVSRFFAGFGYAYGNTLLMPFTKAFFSGGPNSVRAFRARTIGPGTYYGGNPVDSAFLADQPGDIRLELNAELRFKIVSILRGAVFADAGNVWLTRDDPFRPGGKFTGDFMQQMAVGTGVGLRADIKFFVIRFDVAFPIRKPYEPGGPRWVFDQINFGSSDWRKHNIVWNIAIGYPF